ncbi:hypothetical protein FSP39_014632 [Pinctada imbricata]|uniref:Mediator of RNA polymerase II transcription subunit 31 n=1 Tax=Pinctada imbricata TaxID=66713 RepID=A0AA88YGE9_PINIB|nr:hypothetical protein FSP39_014632 [Pinctada imbricata]
MQKEDQYKDRILIKHFRYASVRAGSIYRYTVLAQRGYFKDPTFINYLKYLQYWKEPKYAKFLKYPQCLHFLDLMQYEHFRKEMVNAQCAKFIDDQQLLHWQHYQRKRMALLHAEAEAQKQVQQQTKDKPG